ncbi:MAG TPA: DUF1326 domain-containing protein [Terriglobales bacterium]|nr:DUF1326 domain-containing protein [Terriglobales bacterium]
MRRLVCLFTIGALVVLTVGAGTAGKGGWAMNATAIEACTCPMFCQCYFNTKPAAHQEHDGKHFCKFNMAYKINKGHHGATQLDGAKFWVSGDLGDDFGDGQTEWAVVTFDKNTTKAQREALGAILPKLFPVKWKSFQTAEGTVNWQATPHGAHATLDGGKTAEIRLKKTDSAMVAGKPAVLRNVRYFGAPRNEGFIMMPAELQAYRVGERAFESRGTNGFMITVDITSADRKAPTSDSMAGSMH